jgi:DnaJ-class molecular chaperone
LVIAVLYSFISGNHYVKLVVNTPSTLTERQTELLKEFAELEALKSKDESWTKKFSLLDKAWSRLKSFGGQDAKSK